MFCIFCIQAEAQTNQPINLKGKIIGNLNIGPYCGIQAFGSVIEFKIITISGLDYSNKNIGIIIRCPEFYGVDFFVVDKIYELQIETEVENAKMFDYIVLNENELKKYNLQKRLWAINDSIKKIK